MRHPREHAELLLHISEGRFGAEGLAHSAWGLNLRGKRYGQ
jgi:hypothetical protein